jgi:hypothetical protein
MSVSTSLRTWMYWTCKDKGAIVLNRDWMCDIHGFVELLGGSVVSERAGWAVNEITSYSKAFSLMRKAFICI